LDSGSLESLKSTDSANVVFYVGTFSKCMLPALRLGFIVAPSWAMRHLVAAKNCMDWHCATPIQSAVAAFITGGHLARHVRKMRDIYRQRREAVRMCLEEGFGNWLRPINSHYGLHIAATANLSIDLEGATQALRRHNVNIHTLRRYFIGQESCKGLIFGYGSVDVPAIRRGLTLLRKALKV
jgi:GntR family transcriptional regulator/MocR family aminotransferase